MIRPPKFEFDSAEDYEASRPGWRAIVAAEDARRPTTEFTTTDTTEVGLITMAAQTLVIRRSVYAKRVGQLNHAAMPEEERSARFAMLDTEFADVLEDIRAETERRQ